MASINKNVWGNVTQNTYWGGSGGTISSLISKGKLAINIPYDTTIAICNLVNSPKIRTIFFPINWNGGYVSNIEVDRSNAYMSYFMYPPTSNFALLDFKNATYTGEPKDIFPIAGYSQWLPDATNVADISVSPVLQLDAYRVCILPRISAFSVDPTGRGYNENLSAYFKQDMTIDEYFKTYITQYPYISNVNCEIFVNTSSNRNSVRSVSNPIYPAIIGNLSCYGQKYMRGLGLRHYNDISRLPLFGFANNYGYRSVPVKSFENDKNNTALKIVNTSQYEEPALWGNDNEIKVVPTDLATGDPENVNVYVRCICNVNKQRIINACAATYGLPVATNVTAAERGNWDNSSIYLPIMDKKGNISNTTSGNDNKNNPYYNNNGNNNGLWDNGIPAKPSSDPNSYTDKINLNKPKLTTTGIFNRTFALTSTSIKKLSDYLWNADETIFNEIVKGLSLMGGNPIDGLIDLRLYPFNVAEKSGGGSSKSIVVGRTDTKVQGIEISDYNAVLDLGNCTFFPNFGNFLDYEPFTTASLYIPYVGIVPISTADFMGQTISCKMVVDITTGSCTAIVFANDIPIIYKNGNIGVEIPMTGTNSAEYASRIAGGLTSGATDVALGATSKSVGQVVSGVGSIVDSALSVNNTMYNTAGSSSPACGLWQPQNCYFIIQRPVPIVPENYGHTVGYACNYQSKIGDCSGYTQTYNVDVSSINAPESEKNAIAEILNSGFYA